MSRVGIYGGTFDPIHLGHLHVISQLFEKNLIDELLLVPAGQPLLREHSPTATSEQRLAMCKLAILTLPEVIREKIKVSSIEILRAGPSYAFETVQAIQALHQNDEIFLIIGADAFAKISQWHRSEELQALVTIITINRPGFASTGIDIGALDVAATAIRQGLSAQIPENVAAYIRENGLYDNQ